MTLTATLSGELKDAQARLKAIGVEHAAAETNIETLISDAKTKHPGFNHLLASAAEIGSSEHDVFLEIDAAVKTSSKLKEESASINEAMVQTMQASGDSLTSRDFMASDRPTRGGIGERFVASGEYQELQASGALQMSGDVRFPNVAVASREETRAMLATSDGSGMVPIDQQLSPSVSIPKRAPRLLDFVTIASTDSDTIDFSKMVTRTDNAAETAVGTASAESIYEWAKETVNVKRIPHHAKVYKSQLADAPRMETEVNHELTSGVLLRSEKQILVGDGIGENLKGILNTAGIATLAKGTDTIGDAVHMGITAVRIALEDDITAIGVHPSDYQRYVLAKDGNSNYLSGRGPQESTARTMWGYPTIVSTVFTEGTAVPANWAWAALWVRSGISLASGYIDKQFIEDAMTIIAEYRAAFGVKQPRAFCTVTGLNA